MQISARAASALMLAILLGAPASASTKPAVRHVAAHRRAVPTVDMYSRRALRRAATLLQLKLLELRKARLERVRSAIEKRLPIDDLLHDGGP